jgi:hypothetical protein
MSRAQRIDLNVGKVPSYGRFVRHLWAYDDPNGFSVGAPPVVYRVLFDDEDCGPVRAVVKEMQDRLDFGDRVGWVDAPEYADQPDRGCWELRFKDLKALHTFCVMLGDRARMQEDVAAVRVGEFIMWTLGFRWV